jgi:hypothetical protein
MAALLSHGCYLHKIAHQLPDINHFDQSEFRQFATTHQKPGLKSPVFAWLCKNIHCMRAKDRCKPQCFVQFTYKCPNCEHETATVA